MHLTRIHNSQDLPRLSGGIIGTCNAFLLSCSGFVVNDAVGDFIGTGTNSQRTHSCTVRLQPVFRRLRRPVRNDTGIGSAAATGVGPRNQWLLGLHRRRHQCRRRTRHQLQLFLVQVPAADVAFDCCG